MLLFGGFLRSLQFTSLSAITYAEIEPRQVGSATGMASVGQQVSVSFGVAVGAMVVELSEGLRGHTAPETADFSAAFVVVGLMSMISALLMLRLPADAGDEISGRAVPAVHLAAAPGPYVRRRSGSGEGQRGRRRSKPASSRATRHPRNAGRRGLRPDLDRHGRAGR